MKMFLRFSLLLGLPVLASCVSRAEEAPIARQAPTGEVWLTQQQIRDAKLAIDPVEERDVLDSITTSGRVTFDDLRVSHVFSPVTGRVTKILANPGQRVKKGDALLIIQSPDVGSAFSDVRKAEADQIAAEHEFNRQKELFAHHAGAQRDYEMAEDNYRKAQAEMERAKQKSQLLRAGSFDKVTQEYTLRALIDGEVIARNVNPGFEVQGQYTIGQAPELFTIGELNPIWVMADLFEMDFTRVQVGSTVEVKVVAYPGRTFEGKVEWVSAALDPATRTAKVRCRLDNKDKALKPEMYATVTISSSGGKKAPSIPRNAVLRLGDQTVVFVQIGKTPSGQVKFERRPVSVDEDQGKAFVQVMRGVEAGEMVVSSGAILLSSST